MINKIINKTTPKKFKISKLRFELSRTDKNIPDKHRSLVFAEIVI